MTDFNIALWLNNFALPISESCKHPTKKSSTVKVISKFLKKYKNLKINIYIINQNQKK